MHLYYEWSGKYEAQLPVNERSSRNVPRHDELLGDAWRVPCLLLQSALIGATVSGLLCGWLSAGQMFFAFGQQTEPSGIALNCSVDTLRSWSNRKH